MPKYQVKILLEDSQSGTDKDIGNVLVPGDIDESIASEVVSGRAMLNNPISIRILESMGFNVWQLRFEMDQWPEETGQVSIKEYAGATEIVLPENHPAIGKVAVKEDEIEENNLIYFTRRQVVIRISENLRWEASPLAAKADGPQKPKGYYAFHNADRFVMDGLPNAMLVRLREKLEDGPIPLEEVIEIPFLADMNIDIIDIVTKQAWNEKEYTLILTRIRDRSVS